MPSNSHIVLPRNTGYDHCSVSSYNGGQSIHEQQIFYLTGLVLAHPEMHSCSEARNNFWTRPPMANSATCTTNTLLCSAALLRNALVRTTNMQAAERIFASAATVLLVSSYPPRCSFAMADACYPVNLSIPLICLQGLHQAYAALTPEPTAPSASSDGDDLLQVATDPPVQIPIHFFCFSDIPTSPVAPFEADVSWAQPPGRCENETTRGTSYSLASLTSLPFGQTP